MFNSFGKSSQVKLTWLEKAGYSCLIIVLAIYPIYASLISGFADGQLTRHLKFINGNSDFFNPWQYRVFAPFFIEGIAILLKPIFYQISGNTFYANIFKGVRFCQHLIIFGLAWKLYRYFNPNRLLVFFTIPVLAASMGSATLASDFSFNNYFEIIFYLAAVLIIFYRKNIFWLMPLTLFATLNRETSLLLPFLLFIDYQKFLAHETRKKYWSVFWGCLILFVFVFIGVRYYYGYQPPAPIGMETGWPMLYFNLTDPLTIIKLFATLSILPLYCFFNIRKTDFRLQLLFWLMVPAWFAIHFWLVWARETRVFLVPLIVVFLPIVLDLIQKNVEKPRTA